MMLVKLAVILAISVVPILTKPTATEVQPNLVDDIYEDPGQRRAEKSCNESQWMEIRTKQLPACLGDIRPRILEANRVKALVYAEFPLNQIKAALCDFLWQLVNS